MKFSKFVLMAALLCMAPHAKAIGSLFHPDLVQAKSRFDAARGPRAYAALRRIWGTWDRANPAHVEETLLEIEHSERVAAPVRVYAGLLSAYARNRRGDFKGARNKIATLGFIDRWLIVGPFDNEGKAGYEHDFGPELDFASAIVPGRAYSGKERPVRWRAVPLTSSYGWLDTSALIRPEQKICVYATTFVAASLAARAPRPLSIWVGTAGAFKLFWNGEQIFEDPAYRGHDADRYAARVTLEPGQNNLTLKACGEEAAPVISVRLADINGAPDPKLVVTNDVAASLETAKLVQARIGKSKRAKDENENEKGQRIRQPDRQSEPKPRQQMSSEPEPARAAKPVMKIGPRGGLEGPLQTFTRLTSTKTASAADLYSHAEYLVYTEGDDKLLHSARDLARQAAEREPTVERLLLVSELVEDRNQQREWLDRAEKAARASADPAIELLLAQAGHARGSPNWRDSLPFYDRVLALDPDNVRAIYGRAHAYNEAGMKRTALAMLERAAEQNPESVNVLNMHASQLRVLGRTTESAEAAERYSMLRFDDRTYLNGMVELAVARRNKAAAERWLERLLDAEPDSQWALGAAARTHRALGQPERAIASYRRALELAPEDVGTLRTLADLLGELGKRDQQLSLLQDILRIRPQDRAVREYVEQIQPKKPRADEAYAWDSRRFLQKRHAPAAGQNRRTLRDLTVTTVFENGLSSKFRQVVFQPLTDTAAASARQYAFQYQPDREVVQLRGARVYRGDGKIDEAVEYGEGAADDPSIAMYTSAKTFYVELPRLEPGDVVELRYRIDDITPNNDFANYFGEVVYMQSSEPVANAEYVLMTPKSRTVYIDHRLPGVQREVKEVGEQRIYRFVAPNVPAMAPEPAMPPWPEVLGFVHVSTYRTWAELGRWYFGLVRDQFDLDDETRKLARQIGQGAKTELDKVRAVYGWVVKNTRYVALEFGIYGYKPRRCVQTVARGWGDCKDKATVIVTLLKELGIASTIVIVRTQLRGDFASTLPSLAPFDHAIVYVPSLDMYLDGTAEYTGSTELPKLDLDALALLINQGDAKLKRLPGPDPEKNLTVRKLNATLGTDGAAKLDLAYETQGAAAGEWRRRYHAIATQRDRIASDLGNEFPGFTLLAGGPGLSTSNLDDIEQPVQIKARGSAPAFARREGKQLSMQLTTSFRLTPTYASLSQRRQDVRILAFSSLDDRFVVKLPAGMKVISAPPNTQQDTPFGSFQVQVEQQPGQVTVQSRLLVKATRVRPAQYAAWKKFCADADRAMSPPLLVGP